MSKYKLIKEYPNNKLHVGNVVESIEDKQGNILAYIHVTYQCFTKKEVEENPEFWQKVKEEKLCVPIGTKFKHCTINNDIYTIEKSRKKGYVCICWQINGKRDYLISNVNQYIKEGFWIVQKDFEILEIRKNRLKGLSSAIDIWTPNIKHSVSLESMLNKGVSVKSGDYYIHSIKRVSDGEIFTVGDNIKLPNSYTEKIKKIEICENKINIYYEPNMSVTNEDGNWFEMISKKKEPLFISEDGVEIYEGDEFWEILNNNKFSINKVKPESAKTFMLYKINRKGFSTKEAAEEYVLMNKPCLSINEIRNIKSSNISRLDQVKQLVKSKM